ncbi:pentatricopeptide repeat-containing protein At3g48250, chloroplastic [Medicago truncatula]|uniref:pentatricopeptide repeat-containing protein At3g48250, chloroplastic n=1 Tax=Medicago truncatula TaxID=3880 RepID=UPI0019675D81|nr:pentatricopeptide repeat-containing protein At3g48250, chloroplastic [Medicago truncatula]
MNRVKAITTSLRFLKSSKSLSTPNQVTHFSSFTFSIPLLNHSHDLFRFHNNHQKHCFSSKPNMILERVYTNDWSEELEKELEACRESLTHETVVYVLNRLDKNPIKVFTFFNWVSEKDWFMCHKVGASAFWNNFVIRVMKELRDSPLKAYKFFHWVGKQSGYQQNTVTYNAVARVLPRMESIEEFWSIIEEMKSVGHELDLNTYIKISRKLQKNKMMEDAVKLYEHMMDSSYKPSVLDCIMLLKSISASDKPNLDLVFRVAKKFESSGYTLSKAVYDGIHRSLTSAGKFDEAEKIVETMKNDGYEPDSITYSQLIFGLCKTGRFEEALKAFDDMKANNIRVNIKSTNIHVFTNKPALVFSL